MAATTQEKGAGTVPKVEVGDRVRVTGLMPDDPHPLPVGAEGTVVQATNMAGQIMVDWDPEVGRTLILLDKDPFEVL